MAGYSGSCILTSKELTAAKETCDMVQRQFRIAFVEDFIENPALSGREEIQGILMVPNRKMFPFIRDESFVSSFPNVKIVATPSVGVDHLDVDMLRTRGIAVSRISNEGSADVVAEFGFGLLIAIARNLHLAMRAYLDQDFSWISYHESNSGSLLSGATLGIVGMGTIGYRVAEMAAAFKVKILYHNRTQRTTDEESHVNATYCQTLDDLLRMSDYVMLTVPLTDETRGLIGARELNVMRPSASLINICRGDVVDHDALVEALKRQIIRGAALDVTSPEPLPRDHPLLRMPNVIVTPHAAWATQKINLRNYQVCLENIRAAITGDPIQNEVKLSEAPLDC